jgi:hypothetical protein
MGVVAYRHVANNYIAYFAQVCSAPHRQLLFAFVLKLPFS